MPTRQPSSRQALIERHDLAGAYLDHAQKWFAPLADAVAVHQKGAQRPVLVGLNGSQGCGKTTVSDYLCRYLEHEHGLACVSLSLDDFYLTRAERLALAREVHPLLATRGVPGTHDMNLLGDTLDHLLDPDRSPGALVPRFDKAVDDRVPPGQWDRPGWALDVVVLEGWCLGARAVPEPDLEPPVNALERDEDADGTWRRYVNAALARSYAPVFERVDLWAMLQAPSFDCVYRWRREQEHKLARSVGGRGEGIMDDGELARFIQFYERLTRRCLEQLPAHMDYLFELDAQRAVVACRGPDGRAAG